MLTRPRPPGFSQPLPALCPREDLPEGTRTAWPAVISSSAATAVSTPSGQLAPDALAPTAGGEGEAALTWPSALPIGESSTKSGGAITSTRATASSFSCWETQS